MEHRARLQQSYRLLNDILPGPVIEQLQSGKRLVSEHLGEVSVLFTDIVGFTTFASTYSTPEVVNLLDCLFCAFDELCDKHGVFKVETIGDAYMCVAGHNEETQHDQTGRVISMGLDMVAAAEQIFLPSGDPVKIRVGIHTGPAHAGVIGLKRPRYCLFGDTVNVASRMESTSFPQCVQVSDKTYSRYVASGSYALGCDTHSFKSLGPRSVKGKGYMQTWL
eukprot:CAMPEP_0177620078 /NCGR_PEP_ID=MMETSP0419_2-20121207/26668_1 /TAXON_ID=582737 /ORGANISM="Tetraselmis sp., Strain GSL018" /LENGTH=220 /DNA_ID=CAMNT_0019119521 /DNA_START=1730 /DNA_END=2388 /DNA_ORIENTATION=+